MLCQFWAQTDGRKKLLSQNLKRRLGSVLRITVACNIGLGLKPISASNRAALKLTGFKGQFYSINNSCKNKNRSSNNTDSKRPSLPRPWPRPSSGYRQHPWRIASTPRIPPSKTPESKKSGFLTFFGRVAKYGYCIVWSFEYIGLVITHWATKKATSCSKLTFIDWSAFRSRNSKIDPVFEIHYKSDYRTFINDVFNFGQFWTPSPNRHAFYYQGNTAFITKSVTPPHLKTMTSFINERPLERFLGNIDNLVRDSFILALLGPGSPC
jgi:hypothetical protein